MTGPDPSRRWQRVEAWMRHAAEDARIAHACLHIVPPSRGGAAFHCQQAAEKLLKGFMVQAGVDFRKTHDLDTLSQSVLPHAPSIEPLLNPIRAWTTWSVAWRYPGEAEPEPDPDVEELREALDLITRLTEALRSRAPPADESAGTE